MTDISHNLIGKINNSSIAVLSEIDTISRDLNFDFFIVGVMARDILLQHAHGLPTIRATSGIDIGVFVSGWDRFRALKEALVSTGKFKPTRQQTPNYAIFWKGKPHQREGTKLRWMS